MNSILLNDNVKSGSIEMVYNSVTYSKKVFMHILTVLEWCGAFSILFFSVVMQKLIELARYT